MSKPMRKRFTKEEDEKIRQLVLQYGTDNWMAVSSELVDRTARQCRERYRNFLDPTIQNGPWGEEEEKLLIQKVQDFGFKWIKIQEYFPNRSEINLKNHWAKLNRKPVKRTNVSPKPKPITRQQATINPVTPTVTLAAEVSKPAPTQPITNDFQFPEKFFQIDSMLLQEIMLGNDMWSFY